jgi:pimeloyl-ACP methyl ester carboxylesterase
MRIDCTWLIALAPLALIGCTPQGGGGGDDDGTLDVAACRDTIDRKIAQAQAGGYDVSTWPVTDAEMMNPANATGLAMDTSAYNQYYRDDLSRHPGCTTVDLYYDKANTLPFDPGNGTLGYDAESNGNNDFFWQDERVNPALGATNVIDPSQLPDGDVARIPGYDCAAKEYVTPNLDKHRPVVILVHGNSVRPHTWEEFELDPAALDADGNVTAANGLTFRPVPARNQLASRLIDRGYRVIAFDARTDRIARFEAERNPARNMNHAWAVPILQSLITAVIRQNLADDSRSNKGIVLIGHSLGGTVVRDALRRNWLASRANPELPNPLAYTSHVIMASTGHHGVLTYDQGAGGEPPGYCDTERPTMRGWATCEYGSLLAYTPTYFSDPLNGYKDLFSTPCADGDFAFGQGEACDGNVVRYTNVYMEDPAEGSVGLDGFLNANSMTLDMPGCVDNRAIETDSFDWSGYFWKGILAAHMGSVRSEAGLAIIVEELEQ